MSAGQARLAEAAAFAVMCAVFAVIYGWSAWRGRRVIRRNRERLLEALDHPRPVTEAPRDGQV